MILLVVVLRRYFSQLLKYLVILVRSAEAGLGLTLFGYLACKILAYFTSAIFWDSSVVVFLLRLHVLRFIMKIFTCLALWLGRQCYCNIMCALSGTRRAIEGISMRYDVTQQGGRSDVSRSG